MPKTCLLRVMSMAFLIFHIEIDTSIMHCLIAKFNR